MKQEASIINYDFKMMENGSPLNTKILKNHKMMIESARLYFEKALFENEEHLHFLMALWKNKEVMTFVGFPKGISYTQEKMKNTLAQTNIKYFLAREKKTQKLVGQGKEGLSYEKELHFISFLQNEKALIEEYSKIKEPLISHLILKIYPIQRVFY